MKSTVVPIGNEYAALAPPALIVVVPVGYTANAFAPPFLTVIRKPAAVVGRITPELAPTVVTLFNEVVSTVAVP